MKNKIAILIIVSILVLIALSSIQAYLISNTYELKKRAFINETDEAISVIDDYEEMDSIYALWGDDLKNHIADYLNKRISKEEIINRSQKTADSLNTKYKKLFDKFQKDIGLGYEVGFKVKILSIVLLDRSLNDTLYTPKENQKTRFFGDDFEEKEANIVNTARWYTEHDFIEQIGDDILTNTFNLEIKTQSILLIKDWKRIVYGRMAALFIGSVLIFLFVIGLLYYSIKNLVTQKKIAEIKTDFINNITHELKTPLATLSVASKSLKNETIKNNKQAFDNTLNIVDRQNDRLQKLIDQVMTNSLSSDAIVLNKEQVIDNNYFTNLIEDFKLSKLHQDVQVVNDVCDVEILLRVDKFHFATAIINILENAVKYGKEKTIIIVKTEVKKGHYTIAITDNGIGISEKDQEYIFDKFFRASDGNIHNVKGLGLGLYYTNQIIKAHNGSITLKSDLNKGTTFTLTIPMN